MSQIIFFLFIVDKELVSHRFLLPVTNHRALIKTGLVHYLIPSLVFHGIHNVFPFPVFGVVTGLVHSGALLTLLRGDSRIVNCLFLTRTGWTLTIIVVVRPVTLRVGRSTVRQREEHPWGILLDFLLPMSSCLVVDDGSSSRLLWFLNIGLPSLSVTEVNCLSTPFFQGLLLLSLYLWVRKLNINRLILDRLVFKINHSV